MRKKELIDFIRKHSFIFDEPVPEINSPILKPTKYIPKPPANKSLKSVSTKDEIKRKNEIRELEEMLGLRTSKNIPEIKVTIPEEIERDKKIENIKEINRLRQLMSDVSDAKAAETPPQIQIEERASALNGFVRQFRIQGINGFGPVDFMQLVKEEVLKLVRNNRGTKVNIILNPEMTRLVSEFTEELQYAFPFFQSGVIINLKATDEEREYDIANEIIQERLQEFNENGSGWVFES